MNIIWAFVKKLIWDCVRLTFQSVRCIAWYATGVKSQIRASKRSDAYRRTAHVRKILFRFKLDEILERSIAENIFLTVHESFQDPEYVLKKNVTIFYVTEKEVTFVETDPKIDAKLSENGAFVRVAQYHLAKKVISMPIHAFQRLMDSQPDPDSSQIVFVANSARCGSTLITQVFEESKCCVSWSEPDAFNAIIPLEGRLPEEKVDRICYNTVKFMCRPDSQLTTRYFIKPISPAMGVLPRLFRIFPKSKCIFMYREGLKSILSMDRAAYQMPLLNLILYIGRIHPIIPKLIVSQMGLPTKPFERRVRSRLQFSTIIWGSAIQLYLQYRERGLPIVAVKYEDMVTDPQKSFRPIFEYVGIPFDPDAVTRAMGRDSQRGSVLSLSELQKYKNEEIDDNNLEYIGQACDDLGLPRIPGPYDAPGTITKMISK